MFKIKALTIIFLILLIIGLIFLGSIGVTGVIQRSGSKIVNEEQIETEDAVPSEESETGELPVEEPQEIIEEEKVEKIEFYLDGPRESGISLGQTELNQPRQDVEKIFGSDYLTSGFTYTIDLSEYAIEPGIHTIFIYSDTNLGNSKNIIKKLIIKDTGEESDSPAKIFVDNPQNSVSLNPEKIRIEGWAANTDFADNTGIDKVEIYLDGTNSNGIFLGDANYGTIARQDVADTVGSQYLNSGFYLDWDASKHSANQEHFLFTYAHTINGDWDYIVTDIYILDENKVTEDFLLEIDDNGTGQFEADPLASIIISGWSALFDSTETETGEEISAQDKMENFDPYQIRKVVFASDRDGGDFDIYICNLDGSDLIQLTDNDVDDLYPGVSHDGSQIAYTTTINDLWQIIIMNIDGSGSRQLTTANTLNSYPSWSYDGKYIFFESKIDASWDLCRINADGTDLKRLTFDADSDEWHPSCHASKPLVYYEIDSDGREDIMVMDFDGNNIKAVIEDDERNRTPDASSGQDILVFSSYRVGNSEIFVSTLDGDDMKQITSIGGKNIHPSLSPDGKYIGFDSDFFEKLRIYIYSFEDDDVYRLIDDKQNNYKDPFFLFY